MINFITHIKRSILLLQRHLSSHLPTYLCNCLHTYLQDSSCLHTYLPTYVTAFTPTYLDSSCLHTYLRNNLHITYIAATFTPTYVTTFTPKYIADTLTPTYAAATFTMSRCHNQVLARKPL